MQVFEMSEKSCSENDLCGGTSHSDLQDIDIRFVCYKYRKQTDLLFVFNKNSTGQL